MKTEREEISTGLKKKKQKLMHACNPSYLRDGYRRILSSEILGKGTKCLSQIQNIQQKVSGSDSSGKLPS
jgi:hypothetical protein